MSRLDDLIQEYCPDGVEYRKIGDIANYEQPGRYLVKSTKYDDSFATPVLTAGQSFILGYSNETFGIYPASEDNPVIIFDDFTGAFKWVDFPFKAKSSAMKMITANENLTTMRYLYHLMGYINFTSNEHKRLWIGTYSKIKVPLPALPVQREIVRILDEFTLLSAELSAELAARKKQYEYYRDVILNSVDAEEKQLGDVCKFIRGPFGGSLKKSCFVDSGYAVYEQQNAIYSNLDIRYYIDEEKYKELKRFEVLPGDIIVSCSGTIGKTFIIPVNAPKGIINQALLKLTPFDELDVNYLQYFFENKIENVMNESSRGGGIKNVPSVRELKEIKISVPSVEKQKEIVLLLDNFSSICTDISSGLPAEIEARQKQYEYYRDQLLTFKELK